MKKHIAILLSLTLSLTALLSGCGQAGGNSASTADSADADSSAGGQTYKIGVTMSSRDQFLSTLEKGILDAAAAAGDFEIETFDANNDVQKQYEHINTFTSKQFDAIVVNLVDTNTGAEVLKMVGDIPVIFVDRRPAEELLVENKTCYVGAEEYKAGQFQGEFLSEFFKDKSDKTIRYVMFKGTLGLENTENRTRGALETLEKSGFTLEQVFEDTANFDRSMALDKMNTLLGTGKEFDCVIANNDEMALGALEAMKLVGKDLKAIPVVGIDCTDVAAAAIKAGEMACSIYQNPAEVGAACFAQAFDVVTTGKMSVFKDVPFQPVTIDTIDTVRG
ncbi:substrate-binding domain-containing protein [Agathobaculum sp. NTUH-O15-33]|uniref:substrate-binding domain-containing protein n=1 Tax=Agathobaculum sp. NTUH-O15-33 TaxID=3079302 RepID=UPI002958654A|nr:substrate-binding domain-containing protein [Agathobaculum sp. NTUH-O15-33]WNX84877.1 substrate-binding domain-containing protein [Agathobaculum sp. NTUH-O15-33]